MGSQPHREWVSQGVDSCICGFGICRAPTALSVERVTCCMPTETRGLGPSGE